MSGDNQIEIPQSFIALFLSPGRERPAAPFETVLARYELCEDMAQTLIDHARALAFKEAVPEAEILQGCLQGLLDRTPDFDTREAQWVVRRLAELLDWQAPEMA